MKKFLKIFVAENEINDATNYYVETISKAFERQDYDVIRTSNVKNITKKDLVFVITLKSFLSVYFYRRKQPIIIWFQGIVPEEALLQFEGQWSARIRYIIWSFLEKFILKHSYFSFFVSESMLTFYLKKYKLNIDRFYLMPCFNLKFNDESFNYPNKYDIPSFVYAGSLSQWQCIEQTLTLWSEIQRVIPSSRFVLLTNEVEKGEALARSHNINNIEVKYVKSAELPKELVKYKYGFLLRDDIPVNNVATPTKLNSYMACGVIPIYTEVIHDFSKCLNKIKYKISIQSLNQIELVIPKILEMEASNINPSDVRNDFKKVFETYYSRSYHIEAINKFFR